MPITVSPDPPISISDPEAIRTAIDATDERARLLRRLLRIVLRLRNPSAASGPTTPKPAKGGQPNG